MDNFAKRDVNNIYGRLNCLSTVLIAVLITSVVALLLKPEAE